MGLRNPFLDPDFLPTLRVTLALLAFGFGLVLFFARKDLRAGLRGELGKRFLSWMVITPVFLAAVFIGGLPATAILLFFFIQVIREYSGAVGVERPYAYYLYALIPVTFLVATFWPELYFVLPTFSIILLTSIPILTGRVENLYQQLSLAGRGYLYLVWSIAHLILLKDLVGNGMIVAIGAAIALSDVMQYTIGKLFGRHIISPPVNPRKAWEGLAGDLLGAGVGLFLFDFAFPQGFGLWEKLGLAVAIGLGSAWGDLISSMIKRAAGTKDWGEFLPGHGGILDRANSMVVALPLAYYFIFFVQKYSLP